MGHSKDAVDPGRRRFAVTAAGTTIALGAAGLAGLNPLARAQGAGRPLRVGLVSPQTGQLAGFGEVDKFTQAQFIDATRRGIVINGRVHPVQVWMKDCQSNPNKAAEAATDLILRNEIDLMVVGGTPETTNPVSDQCELNGVPCISTAAPWQAWYFTRGGTPKRGFEWTYHFYFGLEDVIEVFTNMWAEIPTNKIVGLLFSNDGDGNAWGDPKIGFPPVLKARGYKVVDPGRYQNMQADFSAYIAAFKAANVEIVAGVPTPPDFKTFWTQAKQQGFKPKIVTVGKALAFPSAIEAVGDIGEGISQESFWSANRPFRSSMTGQSAMEVATAYEKATGKPWSQPLGCSHAMFEVALDALRRTSSIDDKEAIRDAIAATNLNTVVGPLSWAKGPVRNVAKTPLVGAQWFKGKTHPYDLLVVNNKTMPGIPVQGKFRSL